MDFEELECGSVGASDEARVGVEDGAGCGRTCCVVERADAEELERFVAEGGGDARPGCESMDFASAMLGRKREVEDAVGFAEFFGEGDAGIVLRFGVERVGGELGEDTLDECWSVLGKLIVQLAGSLEGIDGAMGLGEDEAGVHLVGECDDAVAGGDVAGKDGGVDGGGAAPAWEEGGVEIHREAIVEERGLELLAKGDDNPGVGGEGTKLCGDIWVVDVRGFEEGNVRKVGGGPLGDGGGSELAAAARGLVGLGDDGGELMLCGEHVEGWEAEGAGTEEEELHERLRRQERRTGMK